MTTLETDYLVIGAGAAGMAFTDELIADSEAATMSNGTVCVHPTRIRLQPATGSPARTFR